MQLSNEEISTRISLCHGDDVSQRYASFDLCYNYFYSNKDNLLQGNSEKSCFILYGYLASWGMLRNSHLQDLSPASLIEIVKFISEERDLWSIDIDNYKQTNINYNQTNIDYLIDAHNKIQKLLNDINVSPTTTLVTKIMLGVFGCIPAFDENFKKGMKSIINNCDFSKVNKHSLDLLNQFFEANKDAFCSQKINVIDFDGNKTELLYKKAKLVDMYGFSKGLNNAISGKTIKNPQKQDQLKHEDGNNSKKNNKEDDNIENSWTSLQDGVSVRKMKENEIVFRRGVPSIGYCFKIDNNGDEFYLYAKNKKCSLLWRIGQASQYCGLFNSIKENFFKEEKIHKTTYTGDYLVKETEDGNRAKELVADIYTWIMDINRNPHY